MDERNAFDVHVMANACKDILTPGLVVTYDSTFAHLMNDLLLLSCHWLTRAVQVTVNSCA